MSITTGVVTNGVVVPNSPLPEGGHVEIHLQTPFPESGTVAEHNFTPSELLRMPRALRQKILADSAEKAEEDYRSNKELTGFEAFSEEEFDGDSDSC